MLAILAAALTLTAATPQTADAATSPFDAQARVTEAIAAIRPTAYRRDAVDWAAIETQARSDAATAQDTVDLLPVYSRLLTALGDNHSFVQVDQSLRDAYKARYGREFDADVPRKPQTSTFITRRERTARPLALASGKQAELVTAPKVLAAGPTLAPMPTPSLATSPQRPSAPVATSSICAAMSGATSGR